MAIPNMIRISRGGTLSQHSSDLPFRLLEAPFNLTNGWRLYTYMVDFLHLVKF